MKYYWCVSTQKIEIGDMQMMTAETFNSQINIIKEEIESLRTSNWEILDRDINTFGVEDSFYGFASRKKGENFSDIKFNFWNEFCLI